MAALNADAQVIADFTFDDTAGTPLVELPDGSGDPDATIADSAVLDATGNGHVFDVSDDDPASSTYERTADRLLALQTNGAGQLEIDYPGGFDGNRSSQAFIDFNTSIEPGLFTGATLTLETTAWSFEVEDSDDDELFRLGFGDTSPTNQTAQFRFRVDDTNGIELRADALGDGATDTGWVLTDLALDEDQPVTFVIGVDYTANTYTINYQRADDLLPTTFFAGQLGSDGGVTRGANFLRFEFDDDFADDTFAFERLTVAAIPEPAAGACLALVAFAFRRRA